LGRVPGLTKKIFKEGAESWGGISDEKAALLHTTKVHGGKHGTPGQ